MTRVSTIALLLCLPLLHSQPAAAQDCFCGTAPTFGVTDGLSFELAGVETPDTTIESVLLIVQAPAPQPTTPVVAWCTDGNDPRCMPMQSSDFPSFRALSGGPVAISIDRSEMRAWRVAREMNSVTPAEGFPSALGVRRSLDRPPRS